MRPQHSNILTNPAPILEVKIHLAVIIQGVGPLLCDLLAGEVVGFEFDGGGEADCGGAICILIGI